MLVNAKEATETENGYTGDEVCSVCGDLIRRGEVIPATGAPEEPTETDGGCPWCGETHNRRTLSGWWTEFVHHILFIIRRIFSWFA